MKAQIEEIRRDDLDLWRRVECYSGLTVRRRVFRWQNETHEENPQLWAEDEPETNHVPLFSHWLWLQVHEGGDPLELA